MSIDKGIIAVKNNVLYFLKSKTGENMNPKNLYGITKIRELNSPSQNRTPDPFKITSDDIEKVNNLWINGHIIPEDKIMFKVNFTDEQINSAYAKAVKYCKEI